MLNKAKQTTLSKTATMSEIRYVTGLSQVQFSKQYNIPLNTIKNWECSEEKPNYRKCAPYVKSLLIRAVAQDFNLTLVD